MTVTPPDHAYSAPGQQGPGVLDIVVSSNLPGVSMLEWSGPEWTRDPGNPPGDSLLDLRLDRGLHANATYTFTVTLNVPNPYGVPIRFLPNVGMNGQLMTSSTYVTSASVVIRDATLDGTTGKTPGSGTSTFSVSEANHTWWAVHSDAFDINYSGTEHPSAP